jgi:hypothetical protein
MLNQRLDAARTVTAALNPAEHAADDNCLAALQLGVALYQARKNANLPLHTGAECFAEVHAAITHAHESRSRLIRAHRHMADLRDAVLPGVSPRMMGDTGGCPPGTVPASGCETAPLRAVG